MNHPLVSLIIPAYNQAQFLSAAIESALQQTYRHLEIILMDDGSTDHTREICQYYAQKDPRFHYFYQINQGPSTARNQAILLTKGTYLCFLDADDILEKEKIEKQLEVFKHHVSVDIVYTAIYVIDETGRRIGEVKGQDYAPEDFLAYLFFRNIIPNPNTIMAKRLCLIRNPYNHFFKHAEDYELMLRLAHHYQFKYLDIPLTDYRRHSANLSNNLEAHRQAELKVLKNYSKEHIARIIQHSCLNDQEKRLLNGKILFNMEYFSEAISIFQLLHSSLAYFYLGTCYLNMHMFAQAEESYLSSLNLDNSNPACYNNLGIVYSQLKRFLDAQTCFKKALELKTGYLDAKYNLETLQTFQEIAYPRITLRELRRDLLPYV